MGKANAKNPMVNHPIGNPGNVNPRIVPRDQLEDSPDNFIPEGRYPEGTVCTGCRSLYHNQHWTTNAERAELLINSGAANEVMCPACRKIEGRSPHGIVILCGDYWKAHREDIVNLIRNEESRGHDVNPLERVMDLREEADCLVVETTNEKLAQRIGKHIHQAHKGTVDYKWPDGNRLLRVEWERNLE